MAQVVENEEKVFEHSLGLPTKVQTRMIDKMGTRDRCRLTRCSKRCNQEAKSSKQYIHGLQFHYNSNKWISIQVKYQQIDNHGYSLSFYERSGKKMKAYTSLDRQASWEVELDDSANIFQCAFEEFRKILQMSQNLFKVLDLTDSLGQTVGKAFDYGIESLNSLEHLHVQGSFDAVQLLSKIQHPLKTLSLNGKDNEQLVNCEQLYEVRDELTLWTVKLRNENFLRLSVKNLKMGLGNMTEKDIFKFIRSWQDGTIGREIEYNFWWFDEACFDKKKLFRLLRIEPDQQNEFIDLKHFKKHGKIARLYHFHSTMHFCVSNFRI